MEAMDDTERAALVEERRRRDLTYLALIAEKAGRFEDMLSAMCRVARFGTGLTAFEHKCFWNSFNSLVEKKISAWNIAVDVLKAERKQDNGCVVKVAQEYRFKIEEEVKEICNTMLDVIKNYLIPSSNNAETIVYFHKMAADCHYKVAELINSSVELMENDKDHGTMAGLIERMEKRNVFAKSSEEQERAWKVAQEKLPAASPGRLTLALNLSEMFYKLNSGARAYQLVEEAYDDAKRELKSLIWSKETKELMSALEHRLAILGSIDDGAYRRVLVEQEQQAGLPEGVKQGSDPADAEQNYRTKETKEPMFLLKHDFTLVKSIDDRAYRRVLVNQEQQAGLPEGVKHGSDSADAEQNYRTKE